MKNIEVKNPEKIPFSVENNPRAFYDSQPKVSAHYGKHVRDLWDSLCLHPDIDMETATALAADFNLFSPSVTEEHAVRARC
jgi:hypothetical protein